jgi:hypothetical protein
MSQRIKIIIVGFIFCVLLTPILVRADYSGQRVIFFIDPSYDLEKRENTAATLQKISSKAYFYIDDIWWEGLDYGQKSKTLFALDSLSSEFDSKIYPTLTSTFGSEANPGIDNDGRITVLIHPMIEKAGGYSNPGDEYPKIQNPKSNEREIVYLNSEYIDSINAKTYLAHEFVHLVTFYQKEKIYNVSEETWLNEARAEYAPTLLGYDDVYSDSNLEKRVKSFLEKPSDSLTEWRDDKADYGEVNLFAQYLVDQYGVKILGDSLHSQKVGILSINDALAKNGFEEDFSQVFTGWTITVLVNDCQLGEKYCYKNPNLKNLRINSLLCFLPLGGDSSISTSFVTRNWAGNWEKIVGGKGTLTLDFDGDDEVFFEVPYFLCDYSGKCQVNFLKLDKNQKGELIIPGFNMQYESLTIIPSIQSKFLGFDGPERSYIFSRTVAITEKTEVEKEAELEQELLAQIDFLNKEIAKVQGQINAILASRGQNNNQSPTCGDFKNDLYFGMKNSPEVSCLQEFLKNQGPEIYPEELVTGNFLELTKMAVARFQEKYSEEILKPLGIERGTGYVGARTRDKIAELLR